MAKELELSAVLAKDAIRNCISSVAQGEDRRNGDTLRSCYWSDATIDFGVFAGSFDDYLGWCVPGSPEIPVTQHFLGQSNIQIDSDSKARAETYVMSYHRVKAGEEERNTAMGARYLDHLEKRDGDWRISARIMIYDWDLDWGIAADWSKGLMGMPFAADHYTGRGQGDFSEGFFK